MCAGLWANFFAACFCVWQFLLEQSLQPPTVTPHCSNRRQLFAAALTTTSHCPPGHHISSAVEAPPKEIFRKDYKVLPYEASHVDMKFELRDEVKTTLTTAVAYKRRSAKDMVLSGESKPALMELVSVKVCVGSHGFPVTEGNVEGAKMLRHSGMTGESEVLSRLGHHMRSFPIGVGLTCV